MANICEDWVTTATLGILVGYDYAPERWPARTYDELSEARPDLTALDGAASFSNSGDPDNRK